MKFFIHSKVLLLLGFITLPALLLFAQKPNYTANERVDGFGIPFGYGFNLGYYGDNYGNPNNKGFDRQGFSYDVALTELGSKLGLNTSRPTLPCYFFLRYGNSTNLGFNNFQLRSSEFASYQTLGVKNHAVFISDATDHITSTNASDIYSMTGSKYRNVVKYPNCDKISYEFKNLYAPIWDNGENGTPVNDTNYYALYVYKLVTTYKGKLKTYEIVNEIDFPDGFDPNKGPGNNGWYDRAPAPCELLNWKAPIYSYIRTMRIAYEVIKSVDPTAFIAIGGIGNESFLDATLRYTDNPSNGDVDAILYPKKGGAYFDVLSYHHYPQYDLRKKEANGTNVFPFVYQRHSDEAVKRTVYNKKSTLQAVLTKYGYDGTTYPVKHFIITEANIPRRTYTGFDYIGSEVAQRNYIMKLFIKAQANNIDQIHIFTLGEKEDITNETNKEAHSGFYENLTKATRTNAKRLQSGIGTRTLTYLLGKSTFDAAQTALLALPTNIDGAAFKSESGKFTYVLWAKTSVDNSEVASANYTFPSSLGLTGLTKADWDLALTNVVTTINSTTVSLTGAPTFFTSISEPIVSGIDNEVIESNSVKLFPIPTQNKLNLSLNLTSSQSISIDVLDHSGVVKQNLVSNKMLNAEEHYFEFKDLNLVPGLYLLKITCLESEKIITSKLIIQD